MMRINNSKCLFIGQVKNFIAGKKYLLDFEEKKIREKGKGGKGRMERERERLT